MLMSEGQVLKLTQIYKKVIIQSQDRPVGLFWFLPKTTYDTCNKNPDGELTLCLIHYSYLPR